MIGIKCCRCAARAQLERHYGIAIMMHHLARCISALAGEASAVPSAIIPASFCRSGPTQRTGTKAMCGCCLLFRRPAALQPGKTVQTLQIISPPPSFNAVCVRRVSLPPGVNTKPWRGLVCVFDKKLCSGQKFGLCTTRRKWTILVFPKTGDHCQEHTDIEIYVWTLEERLKKLKRKRGDFYFCVGVLQKYVQLVTNWYLNKHSKKVTEFLKDLR